MKKIAQTLKNIIKRPADKDTFGTNPKDPWSVKSNISESKMLDQYLKARGINPVFLTKDAKISHAKSFAFQRWRQQHQVEEIQMEEVDKEDTITFDIPLFIRVLEFAREDAKDDMALHKMTEKLISIRDKGTLTMADYDFITKLKEEMGLDESALEKWRKAASERQKKHDDAEKEMKARHAQGKEDMKGSIDRLEKSLNKEETEQIDELNYDTVKSLYDKRRADYHGAEVGKKKKGKEVSAKNVSRSISRLMGFKSTQNTPKSNWKPAFEEVEQIDELKKSTVKSWLGKQDVVPKKKPGMSRKDFNKRVKTRSASWDRALDRLTGHKPTSEESEIQEGAFKRIATDREEDERLSHKVGDSVTVNSKFFGKQKGKVTKVDSQSVHVQRDGKSQSEKYPHDAVVKEGLEEGFKMGDPVRHNDGLSGTVTKDEDKDGLVNWKGPTAGYRVSHSSTLTKRTEVPRWRKTNEAVYQDSLAATQTPFDGGNNPDDCSCNMKKEMSKSARIIKALYKKKGVVKEDMYDHEKEDKSVATYGKKPKAEKLDKENTGEDKTDAALTLSGGKTLTGAKRDTIEIDPMMRNRPNDDTENKKKDK